MYQKSEIFVHRWQVKVPVNEEIRIVLEKTKQVRHLDDI